MAYSPFIRKLFETVYGQPGFYISIVFFCISYLGVAVDFSFFI